MYKKTDGSHVSTLDVCPLYMTVSVNLENQILANTRSQVKRTVCTLLQSVAKYKVQVEYDRFNLKLFNKGMSNVQQWPGVSGRKPLSLMKQLQIMYSFLSHCVSAIEF